MAFEGNRPFGGMGDSVVVRLHPLVIMNLSDHATRARVRNNGNTQRVVGALLGLQRGKEVELLNSFELVTSVGEGPGAPLVVNEEFLKSKLTQCETGVEAGAGD